MPFHVIEACQAFAHFAQLTIFQWQKKNFQRNPNIKWLVIIYLIVSFSCHTEINIKEFIDLLIKAKLYNCNKLRFINSIIRKTTANRLEYNSCTFSGCFFFVVLISSRVLPTFPQIFFLQSACFSYKFLRYIKREKYHFYRNEMASKFGKVKNISGFRFWYSFEQSFGQSPFSCRFFFIL